MEAGATDEIGGCDCSKAIVFAKRNNQVDQNAEKSAILNIVAFGIEWYHLRGCL
ncbi:hypothetical protein JGH11_16370 [Dysgonomonas sp. Marseille-P4677]|uniref:hypothetical protein n=1 Tax=Dysgonomonas sp. Marseille-P4677 TaxID=2364790 RepID=UPI0019124A0D|nr:hypothetical protein [Dysgonomonas sp. Marseille-P4677]MBK5722451.1 hypothetical protein [Dysgonomonas sp. Marseille-P4677]